MRKRNESQKKDLGIDPDHGPRIGQIHDQNVGLDQDPSIVLIADISAGRDHVLNTDQILVLGIVAGAEIVVTKDIRNPDASLDLDPALGIVIGETTGI